MSRELVGPPVRFLVEMGAQQFAWRKAGLFSREYELSQDLQVVGRLRISGFAGRRADFESGRERYTFTRRGRRVQVCDAAGATLGEFRVNWSGARGQLHLPGSLTLTWRRVGWSGMVHVFEDEAGSQPVRFRSASGWRGAGATVEVAADWADRPNLGLLLGLGFFRLVQAHTESIAASSTSVVPYS